MRFVSNRANRTLSELCTLLTALARCSLIGNRTRRKATITDIIYICKKVNKLHAISAVDIMLNGIVFVKFQRPEHARATILALNSSSSQWGTLRAELASLHGYMEAVKYECTLRQEQLRRGGKMDTSAARCSSPSQREEDASDAADSETLPRGWRQVGSRSRPGRVSYENSHVGSRAARISWRPLQRAPHTLHEHDAYLAQQAQTDVASRTIFIDKQQQAIKKPTATDNEVGCVNEAAMSGYRREEGSPAHTLGVKDTREHMSNAAVIEDERRQLAEVSRFFKSIWL